MHPDHYVQIGPHRIRYWDVGEGPAIILLHGLGCMVEIWQHNIPALAAQHRVVALDMIGFGYSDKPRVDYGSIPFASGFMRDFMRKLDIETASLVGNSLGGGLALVFVTSHPEMVDKLVLINAAGLGRRMSTGLRLGSLPFPLRWLPSPSRSTIYNALSRLVYDPAVISDEILESFYKTLGDPGALASMYFVLRNVSSYFGQRPHIVEAILENLPALIQPTLIVWGAQDFVFPLDHARRAAALIPNARLHVFDPGVHMAHIEHPEAFNRLVLDFLSG